MHQYFDPQDTCKVKAFKSDSNNLLGHVTQVLLHRLKEHPCHRSSAIYLLPLGIPMVSLKNLAVNEDVHKFNYKQIQKTA